MTTMTTQQLVDRLERSGLRVAAESLRQDVRRGLVSPLMPSTETPGRGTLAAWSPMSVQRALRMARLRRRKVNGHVLPLLLFLEDGWGWEQILPTLQQAARKAWELDRAYLNKPTRVRNPADLVDNAEQTEEWASRPDHDAIRKLRVWLYGQAWYGETIGNASPVPVMMTILPTLQEANVPPEELAAALDRARQYVERRDELHLPTSGVATWLATLDPGTVERGRMLFWHSVQQMRQQRRRSGLPGSNPLTLGGESPAELTAYLRGSTGRVTPAQMLGACIAQAMLTATIAEVTRSPMESDQQTS